MEELDHDLPKIGRSKDVRKSLQPNKEKEKRKRHHHHHSHRHHKIKSKRHRIEDCDDDLKFPTALKPLGDLKQSQENVKKHAVKIKKKAHDEWKKFVPPLFSVAAENESEKKEQTYGERQRNLYDKFYNIKQQSKQLKKSKHLKQLKSSVLLKSPKKKSLCKSESDTKCDLISDRQPPPSPCNDDSDNEIDRINANLVKKKKFRTRHRSLDQRNPVVLLKPIRSLSCAEKTIDQKGGILDIMQKEITDSPKSIKSEPEELASPSINVEKLKEKFEIYRNSLKKSRQNDKQSSPSAEIKEHSKDIILPVTVDNEKDDIDSINKTISEEKVKLQVQVLKQRMKSGLINNTACLELDNVKIDRHFLDVIGEENIKIKAEPPEKVDGKIDLSDYECDTGKIKKEVERKIIDTDEIVSDESPLPTIVRHYVDAHKTKLVTSLKKIERSGNGESPQIKKDHSKENIDALNTSDYESPLPTITRRYNVEYYRPGLAKNEHEKCEENAAHIQIDENKSHNPSIGGNNQVKQNNVCINNNSLCIKEPVDEKGDKNFMDYEFVEEQPHFPELNLIQMPQVVADLNFNNIDLRRTNLYASSVPLHQIQLNERNLYVSELPLVRISISGTNAPIAQTENDLDKWSPKKDISPIKDQPKITNYFAPLNKTSTEGLKTSDQELPVIADTEPKIDIVTATEKSDIKKELKIKGCTVMLKRLKNESLSKIVQPDMEEMAIDNYSNITEQIETKIIRQRDGRKRKISYRRLSQRSETYHSESLSTSQNSSSHGKNRESLSRQMRQLECFMQQTRISDGCESVQHLPLTHTYICTSLHDDGSSNISHLLEFLYAFRHYKPKSNVISQVIDVSFFCEVEKVFVYEAYQLLQEMNTRFPGVVKVDWKIIEKCLNIVQERKNNELAYLQASLLLKLLTESLKLDLYTKDCSEHREIRQSMAYKIFHDIHSPNSRDLVKYMGLLLSGSQLEKKNETIAGDVKNVFGGIVVETIQDLLEISVDVSSSCICQAGRLAEELKTIYKGLRGMERKTTLVNSIKSSLVRYKLTEVLLEGEYTGTYPLSANFPDSVLQIMECFYKVYRY